MFDVKCSVLDVHSSPIPLSASFFPRLDTAVAPRYVTHMTKLHLLRHPLAQHHLAALRAAATPPDEFRRLVRRLTLLLAAEATRDLATRPVRIATPLMAAPGVALSEHIGLVPTLRAGLGMVDAMLELLPQAAVWHLGVYILPGLGDAGDRTFNARAS
jgi:uracil phosphoribosyltransferase